MTADTQNLRRLENEVKQIVKEMKKAISEKDFERAVSLREREIEIKEEIERTRTRAARRELHRRRRPGRRRGDHLELDRDPRHVAPGGGGREAPQHGGDAQEARHRPGPGDRRDLPGHPALAPRREEPEPPDGLVHLPRALGRREDRGRAAPRRVPLRPPEVARPLRHVRVHGEARRLQADRLAPGLRRPRGGGAAHGADPPAALLRHPPRRDREGAPRHREPPPADPRGRAADRRLRQRRSTSRTRSSS